MAPQPRGPRPPTPRSVTPPSPRRRGVAVGVVAAVLVAVAASAFWFTRTDPPRPDVPSPAPSRATYVGADACVSCHQEAAADWRTSQHAAAMTVASAATVRGQFDGRTLRHDGVTSTFFRRDGRFFVRTDGANGQLADFEVAYTFGVAPLQQYLVRFTGGRLQALSLAWDTRPASAGGQRWFSLYPGDTIRAGDPLHWTGPQQNWNFMCADCHSTNVRRGYKATTREFATTWSDLSVGCESCHGPGSDHVAAVQTGTAVRNHGLTVNLDERKGVTWRFDAAMAVPVRSTAKTGDREIDVCARCHARRAQISDTWKAGDPLEDGFRPSVLEALLYFPDGQQHDEVYTYGSFLQSRMYAAGVTCSDCHNPHRGQLKYPGNSTCTQCHDSGRYETTAHHGHAVASDAAACVTCHMPTRTYMVVDPRHDHSFRVPRPDRTLTLGVPNVCTTACHTTRDAAWAARAIRAWTGRAPGGAQTFAETIGAFDRGEASGVPDLVSLASNHTQPPIVRATALSRLAAAGVPPTGDLSVALRDASPLVRRHALSWLRTGSDAERLRLVPALLTDPVRSVRTEAVHALADLADRNLAGLDRVAFDRGFVELLSELDLNADRPESQVTRGGVFAARGRFEDAEAAFREAIRLSPGFVPASVNLSDLYRARGDEGRADQVLREAIAISPDDGAARYGLGLSLVRQKRLTEAIVELRHAWRLTPSVARYGYVLGVALHDNGDMTGSLLTLQAVSERHPSDRDVLVALALFSEEAGHLADARRHAARLLALEPADPQAQQLDQKMRGASGPR